jgi:hypothetical protein
MARKLLERMKFTVKSIGGSAASLNEVPEDATLVLLLGPTASLSHSELEALERYMSRGGALFLALEAESPTKRSVSAAPFPNAKLARMVGMNFDTTLLASQTKHVRLNQNDSDRTLLIVNTFFSHASVFTLNRDAPRAAVVIFGSGSLESVKSLDMQVEFAVHAPDTFRDIDGDYQRAPAEQFGDFNLAAAVTRRAVARAFVVADSDAFSDFVMSEILSNQVFFVDAVKWLVGEER